MRAEEELICGADVIYCHWKKRRATRGVREGCRYERERERLFKNVNFDSGSINLSES